MLSNETASSETRDEVRHFSFSLSLSPLPLFSWLKNWISKTKNRKPPPLPTEEGWRAGNHLSKKKEKRIGRKGGRKLEEGNERRMRKNWEGERERELNQATTSSFFFLPLHPPVGKCFTWTFGNYHIQENLSWYNENIPTCFLCQRKRASEKRKKVRMSRTREREREREWVGEWEKRTWKRKGKPTMMLRLDVTRGKSKHEKFFSSTEWREWVSESLSLSLSHPFFLSLSLEALNSLTLRLLITRRGIDYHHLDVNDNSYSLDFPFKLSTPVSPLPTEWYLCPCCVVTPDAPLSQVACINGWLTWMKRWIERERERETFPERRESEEWKGEENYIERGDRKSITRVGRVREEEWRSDKKDNDPEEEGFIPSLSLSPHLSSHPLSHHFLLLSLSLFHFFLVVIMSSNWSVVLRASHTAQSRMGWTGTETWLWHRRVDWAEEERQEFGTGKKMQCLVRKNDLF